MTYIAYYRRSTKSSQHPQLQKHSIDRQRAAVERIARDQVIESFIEEESGSKDDRPQLQLAMDMCKKTNSTLIIASLSRLARSARFICELLDGDCQFVCADMPEANKLTLTILAAVAENEVDTLRKRTKEALAVAKLNGVKLGNPDILDSVTPLGWEANKEKGNKTIERYLPTIQHIRRELSAAGVKPTLQRVSDRMNLLGITTPTGKAVSYGFVSHIERKERAVSK